MAVSEDFLEYCLGQFEGLESLISRKMFGGVGLYSQGAMFAALMDDRVFLRIDAQTQARFDAAGAEAFAPLPSKPNMKMPYRELPAEVLELPEKALEWAQEAVQAALRNQKLKKSQRRSSKKKP